jgi:hypothetical protein
LTDLEQQSLHAAVLQPHHPQAVQYALFFLQPFKNNLVDACRLMQRLGAVTPPKLKKSQQPT